MGYKAVSKLKRSRPEIERIFKTRFGSLALAFAIAISLVGLGTALAVRAHNRSVPTASTEIERLPVVAVAKPSVSPAAVQANPPVQRVEAELITIRPNGFEPAGITRPAGRFLLAVDNRSGLEQVLLRLDREAGNRLREHLVPRKKLDWRELVDLTPGRYVLTEANNPGWVCRITITPN